MEDAKRKESEDSLDLQPVKEAELFVPNNPLGGVAEFKPAAKKLTEEELKQPNKGKPPSFFELSLTGQPTEEQMRFIYEFYPEYGNEKDYKKIFTYFEGQAKDHYKEVLPAQK